MAVALWPWRCGRGVAVSLWRGSETVLAERAREIGAGARGCVMVGVPTAKESASPEKKGEREGQRAGTPRKVGLQSCFKQVALGDQGGVCRPVFYYVDYKHQFYDTPA